MLFSGRLIQLDVAILSDLANLTKENVAFFLFLVPRFYRDV